MPKRKDDSNEKQPELPIPGNAAKAGSKPEAVNAGNGHAESAKSKSKKDNGNGETHVLAENVMLPPPSRPFVPGKIELPLHGRDRHNAIICVHQMQPRVSRFYRSRPQREGVRNNLKTVGHAMLHFPKQHRMVDLGIGL